MTTTITKGRESYLPALPEITTYQAIHFLSQPTKADVRAVLDQLWAESTGDDAADAYSKQARILAAILDRYVNSFVVCDAMEAVDAIHRLQTGACLQEMHGCANTDENRDKWLDYEQRQLRVAIQNIPAGIPR